MSTLIADMCLISIKLFIVRTILYATVSNLYNNKMFIRYAYHTAAREDTNISLVDLYNDNLQTTTVFFTLNFTQG